jgi:hypothetical protein
MNVLMVAIDIFVSHVVERDYVCMGAKGVIVLFVVEKTAVHMER